MESVSLNIDGIERRYYFATSSRKSAVPLPLLVMLHGTGGSGLFAADETHLPAFAEAAGFAVAFPDALPPDRSRSPAFLSNPQRWNDGSSRRGSLPHTEWDDTAFLTATILDALERGPCDRQRVYLTGFSNGAGMAFRFAAERSDLLAAVAPVAGYCPREFPAPIQPVPTLFIIGDADPLVPLAGGLVEVPWRKELVQRRSVDEMLTPWATALGCEPEPVFLSEEYGVREEVYPPIGSMKSEFRRITVAGLGHHWPSGRGQLNPRIGGQPSNLLSANDRIWEFVQRHHLA